MEFLLNSHNSQFQIIFQLFLSALLGSLIGLEREYKRKEAGIRTYSLVCLGSALFTLISLETFNIYFGKGEINFNPSWIVGQIALGVGFLGAGVIIIRQQRVEGLTTAAGLWVTAAIGVAVGTQFYFPAFFTTLLTIGILWILGIIEGKLEKNILKK